jgi:hypothetical protein
MAEFYAIVHQPMESAFVKNRMRMSENFFASVLEAETTGPKQVKEEIGYSMLPPLLKKISRLVPPGIIDNGTVVDIGSGFGAVIGYFSAGKWFFSFSLHYSSLLTFFI